MASSGRGVTLDIGGDTIGKVMGDPEFNEEQDVITFVHHDSTHKEKVYGLIDATNGVTLANAPTVDARSARLRLANARMRRLGLTG